MEGNLLVNNTSYGIQTISGDSFIVRNVAYGNTINYQISSNNSYGQIVTGSANMTASNPWANFQF